MRRLPAGFEGYRARGDGQISAIAEVCEKAKPNLGDAMRILNLYADADGESHFRQIEIECTDETPWGIKVSKPLPATAVIFVEGAGPGVVPLHPAPCRQYVINLDTPFEVTASDGDQRLIGVGEVVLVEDTTGRGHITKLLGEKTGHGIFISID